MKAVVAPSLGGPDVLELTELPDPVPGPGQVTIDVAYAGVNYGEVMGRRGDLGARQQPYVPGLEVSGRVREVGEGVTGLRPGARVAALTWVGGYAEIAVADAVTTFALDDLPGDLDLVTAAGAPTVATTAWAMLHDVARLWAGESVLIHAAAGGVGTMAAQMARVLGASRVVGTVGSPSKVAYAEKFGYDEVLVRDDFLAQVDAGRWAAVDLILDSVGGRVREASLRALATPGRLVVYGNASREPDLSHSLWELMSGNKSLLGYGIGWLVVTAPEVVRRQAQAALALLADGKVRLDVTDVLPLSEVRTAHRRMEDRSSTGKLVLGVAGSAT